MNFEHSWGDGVAVMRLIDEVVTDSAKNAFVTPEMKTRDTVGQENVTRYGQVEVYSLRSYCTSQRP